MVHIIVRDIVVATVSNGIELMQMIMDLSKMYKGEEIRYEGE